MVDYVVSVDKPRLKMLEQIEHEAPINLVVPRVVASTPPPVIRQHILLSFFKLEYVLEVLEERLEQKLSKQIILDIFGQLLEHDLAAANDGLAFVGLPPVLEILFDFSLEHNVDVDIVIEVLEEAKELTECIAFI